MATIKEQLTNMLNVGYGYQQSYLASLTAEEKASIGTVKEWSPKDVMVHVVHWNGDVANNIADRETVKPAAFDQHTNDRIWEQYKDTTWAEVEEMAAAAQGELVNNLQELDKDELTNPDRYEWMGGRPLMRSINFTCFYHPIAHIAELYAGRGDLTQANEMVEESAELQLPLVDDDQWRGNVLYNLGCHYAVTGQKKKALKKVGEALALNPGMKSWAKEDSDLRSLHDDPEFMLLVE